MDRRATLLVTCPDRPGIVATVTTFLYHHGVNILRLDQHSTGSLAKPGLDLPSRPDSLASPGTFFMRIEFETPPVEGARPALEAAFKAVVAERLDMWFSLAWARDLRRVAVLVSKHDHALVELLWRWRQGELPCEMHAIISNHEVARRAAKDFELPFHVVDSSDKARAEAELERLLDGVDLVVLARYMQILSPAFVEKFHHRIINIHHSFLPAFVGARPYHQAHERGVKLIGATAHYVTSELDQGPIIEQDVIRVSHRQDAASLVSLGRDIERQVLARAVRWHLEHRVLVHEGRTVVFN
ncbi:MAG: formyltetrahydrofolate deformylase [Deltaproteobacteria bacterium]|jgi:formyltetrahydrofolate deformylase|nr:formyltetrahydrofolate deformylase [Deltaproteobacteria bacterium]